LISINDFKEIELPADAHHITMRLLRDPPTKMVAIIPHRGTHDTQPSASDSDIGEHTRASIDNTVEQQFALMEFDAKNGWAVHGDTWGLNAHVGSGDPFNVTDIETDQRAVNPPVAGSNPAEVARYKLRTNRQADTDESPLDLSHTLDYIAEKQLPINIVVDAKTPQDYAQSAQLLAQKKHFDGKPFIETAFLKVLLKDIKTPAEYQRTFSAPGPDGQPIGDKLNLMWVVYANHVDEFRNGERGMIEALAAHREAAHAAGRLSITELNVKDDDGLSQVAQWIRATKQPWLGCYHPTRESDLLQQDSGPVAHGNWNNVTDVETLLKLGEERVLFMPNGTCCHSINSDLFGAQFDQRPSLARLMKLGANVIVSDTPKDARDTFEKWGIPDISAVMMHQAYGPRPLPPDFAKPPAGVNLAPKNYVLVGGGLLVMGAAAFVARKIVKSRRRTRLPFHEENVPLTSLGGDGPRQRDSGSVRSSLEEGLPPPRRPGTSPTSRTESTPRASSPSRGRRGSP